MSGEVLESSEWKSRAGLAVCNQTIFAEPNNKSIMRGHFHSLICVLILSGITSSWSQEKPKPVENDLMYPSAEAAKPFIDFDGAGFIINGRRTYLSSGSIHYPRVPHELWYDRLLRSKAGIAHRRRAFEFFTAQGKPV